MAIIKELPGRKIIDGFKGTIDFYYYMGIACARKWPRSQGKSQTPDSIAQWPTFTYCSRLWMELSEDVRESYRALARDSGLHGKDWFTRGYLTGIYRYPNP